ncbi:hypothetical protein MPSEU_001029900 [Mayamaea pseudoterrestris]|nr:hypothetical protein MPSEU_001029900 [Mayamaea pseudoterrestris]
MPPASSSCDSSHPNITVRRRRKCQDETGADGKENSSQQSTSSVDKVLRKFRQAADQTCQANFWKDKKQLAESVVRASLQAGNPSDEMIKANEAALFSSARKVIKEATDTNSIAQPCMLVALHTLRSLNCREPSRLEGKLKCLYHVVTLCESSMDEDGGLLAQSGLVAYESLGQTLSDYACQCADDKGNVIAFKMLTKCSHEIMGNVFPAPSMQSLKKGMLVGSMAVDQLSTIGIRASMAAARILYKLTSGKDIPIDLDFTTSLWNRLKKSKLHHTYECLVHIVSKVLSAWLSLNSASDEKEIQHYCKAGYQLLLQAAKDTTDPDHCLELRKQAIFTLLGSDLDEDLQARIGNKFFELACISAHKYSTLHFQQAKIKSPADATKAIKLFHNDLGNYLDSLTGSCPSSQTYTDYCAVRALHVGVRLITTTYCSSPHCIFRNLGGQYAHNDCAKDGDAAAMALFFTSLELINEFEDPVTTSSRSDRQLVIEHFLSNHNRYTYRHFKLLCSTLLHRAIQDFLSQQSEAGENGIQQRRPALEATAQILGSCMSPLAMEGVDSDKLEQASDMLYWCFRGSLSVLERLHVTLQKDEYVLQSDDIIRKVFGVVLAEQKVSTLSEDCVENLAKYLSSLGKRRHEQNLDAFVPLLYSLKLFQLLPRNRLEMVQISSRWTYLSTIYKEHDRREESFLASACALAHSNYVLATHCDKSTIHLEQLFGQMAVSAELIQTIGEGRDTQRKTMVTRLVTAYCDIPNFRGTLKGSSQNDFSIQGTTDSLLMAVSDKNGMSPVNVTLSLSDVIKVVVIENASLSMDFCSAVDRFSVMLEAISCYGTIIQKQVKLDGDIFSFDEYADLSQLGLWFLRTVAASDMTASSVLTSLFRVVCATFLTSRRGQLAMFQCCSGQADHESDYWAPLDSCAKRFLSNALNGLNDLASGVDDWDIAGSSIVPAILMMQLHMGSIDTGQKGRILECIREVGQNLSVNFPTTGTHLLEIAKEIGMTSFSRWCEYMKAEGEKVHAYEVAYLGSRLTANETDHFSLWFNATACLLEGDETVLTAPIPESFALADDESNDISRLKLYATASRLQRSTLFLTSDDELNVLNNNLYSLRNYIKRSIGLCAESMGLGLLHWVLCALEYGLAVSAGRRGNFRSVISFAKECHRSCQAAISNLALCSRRSKRRAPLPSVIYELIAIQLRDREIECRQLIAETYSNIGSWRKALQYAFSAIHIGGYQWSSDSEDATFSELLSASRSSSCQNSRDLQLRRTLLRVVARVTAADRVELLPDVYSDVRNRYDSFLATPPIWNLARRLALDDKLAESLAPIILLTMRLHEARSLIVSGNSHQKAAHLCKDLVNLAATPHVIRAEALYLLGMMDLTIARTRGELLVLWKGNSNVEPDASDLITGPLEATASARQHFISAMHHLGDSSICLARNIFRCLALVSGPAAANVADSACSYLHMSIGKELRIHVTELLSQSDPCEDGASADDVYWTLCALDAGCDFPTDTMNEHIHRFYRRLGNLLPSDWRIVGMAFCPTGELLVGSVYIKEGGGLGFDTACVFPQTPQPDESCHRGLIFDDRYYCSIMSPIDLLIEDCNKHLQDAAISDINCDESKRSWWNQRSELDHRLQSHIEGVEAHWFECETVSSVLFGKEAKGNLFSKFEAAFVASESLLDVNKSAGDSKILLIVDEDLQRFPFEGMQCFEGRVVCRPPSLPFVLAKLYETVAQEEPIVVDARKVSCILDPESNLGGTQQRMAPFLDSLHDRHGPHWNFVSGEAPTKEFMQKQLAVKDGLLLFFGHGTGREYFGRRDIEGMVQQHDSGKIERHVQSSLILMGCSSGRLESVNRKNTANVAAKLPMYVEPEGIAQTYIAAGAPCVVANLWDVTDKDIDRFSMDMLGRFLNHDGASLPECVAQARSACKLQYLVGCAPVCYGLPVVRK